MKTENEPTIDPTADVAVLAHRLAEMSLVEQINRQREAIEAALAFLHKGNAPRAAAVLEEARI